ncbi:MAG: DedA family protein [Patescibacteria group bacterium]|jgi:membrane protein DedA with SNARE-associated domain
MLMTFINWILAITEGLGYWGVFILMTIESSFIPFPSELAIPPAAWLAGQGRMNLFLIIILGTLGSLFGALLNYYLALWLGRPLVYKLLETRAAHFLRIKKEDLERTENMFLKNSRQAIFICRLIPVVRQLISIPAGFTRMPLRPFILLTFSGSFIWVVLLSVLGYVLGANQDILMKYYHEMLIILSIVGVAWLSFSIFKKKKKKKIMI